MWRANQRPLDSEVSRANLHVVLAKTGHKFRFDLSREAIVHALIHGGEHIALVLAYVVDLCDLGDVGVTRRDVT